jgi:hypothetical protein
MGYALLGGSFTEPGELQMRKEVVVAYSEVFSLEGIRKTTKHIC